MPRDGRRAGGARCWLRGRLCFLCLKLESAAAAAERLLATVQASGVALPRPAGGNVCVLIPLFVRRAPLRKDGQCTGACFGADFFFGGCVCCSRMDSRGPLGDPSWVVLLVLLARFGGHGVLLATIPPHADGFLGVSVGSHSDRIDTSRCATRDRRSSPCSTLDLGPDAFSDLG